MARTKTVKSTTKSTDIPVKKTDSFKGKAPSATRTEKSDTESSSGPVCFHKCLGETWSRLIAHTMYGPVLGGEPVVALRLFECDGEVRLVFNMGRVHHSAWEPVCQRVEAFLKTVEDIIDWDGYLINPTNAVLPIYFDHCKLILAHRHSEWQCDCGRCNKDSEDSDDSDDEDMNEKSPEELALREEIKQVAKDLHEGRMVVDEGRVIDLTKED